MIRVLADVAFAVLSARAFARELGFGTNDEFQIGTAVSELATNVVRYAIQGELKFRAVRHADRLGFEAILEDRGPGIPNIDLAMTDQYSTGGSLGLGLPSVKRIMDEFTLRSTVGQGTHVVIRKWKPS